MIYKIENNSPGTFTLTNFKLSQAITLQRGKFRIAVKGDNVGLVEIGSRVSIVDPVFYADWLDEFDVPYSSTSDLLNDLRTRIFFVGSGGGPGVSNHSELNLDDGTNPHGTTKADVGLDQVDNVQQYPNSNPSGFETPAQLNARDAANRDRANHTGTQLAATIVDFQTEVSNNVDVQNNTSKVSADGSIDTHSDVDTTTDPPNIGEALAWDGVNWVPTPVAGGGVTNHSQLILDDGTNPHGTTKADVGLDQVNNVQQYPNTNPLGFETPVQLDARELASRADDVFELYNSADITKLLAFELSLIATGTKRTLQPPDKDGVIALLSDIPGPSRPSYFRATTSSTQDLNEAGTQILPFDIETINEDNTLFLNTANGVQILKETALIIDVVVAVREQSGGNARLQTTAQILINGVPVTPRDWQMYMRDASGHLDSATRIHGYYLPLVPAGVEITVQMEKDGGSNGVVQPNQADTYLQMYAYTPAPQNPPTIAIPTPGQTFTTQQGIAGSEQFVASNNPGAWTLSGQPVGVTINSNGLFEYNDQVLPGTYNIDVIAINGAGSSPAVSFVLEVEAGLTAGFEFYHDGITTFGAANNGDPVPAWVDQSVNANDYNQPNIIDRPTVDSDAFGVNTPGVLFNGNNQFLELTTLTNQVAGLVPSTGEYWMVFRQNAKINANVIFCMPKDTSSSNNNVAFLEIAIDAQYAPNGAISFVNSQLAIKVRQGSGSNYGVLNIPGVIAQNTDYILQVTYQSGLITAYLNGVQIGTDVMNAPDYGFNQIGDDQPTIARRANTGSGANSAIVVGADLFYDFILSPSQRDSNFNALAQQYNISI
jgi:hypothetical protein